MRSKSNLAAQRPVLGPFHRCCALEDRPGDGPWSICCASPEIRASYDVTVTAYIELRLMVNNEATLHIGSASRRARTWTFVNPFLHFIPLIQGTGHTVPHPDDD